MVVGRNNGVVGLTGFSDKKMSGLLFGPQKSGCNNGVVVRQGSTVVPVLGTFVQEPNVSLQGHGLSFHSVCWCHTKHSVLAYFAQKKKVQNFLFLTKNHELTPVLEWKIFDFFKSMYL